MTTLLIQLRQGEEAIPHLAYLRERLPDNPEIHLQWVKALGLQGRTAESRASLEECLLKYPDFAPALSEQGHNASADGNDKLAEEILGRASRLDPGSIATRHEYSLVLLRNGKAAEAASEKKALEQLAADQERIDLLIGGPLQSRPNDPAVPHEIALIAMRSGQHAEALRWFQTALRTDSQYAPTHQALAGYYQSAGNPALAAKHRALGKQFAGSKRP